jgi:hypothetical protein
MIAAIAVAAILVLAIAVLVGIRIGQSVVQADATSLATKASPAPSHSSAPAVVNTPAQSPQARSPEPTPDTSQSVPATSAPSYVEPVTSPPLPEQSFAEVQPLPPVAEAPEEPPADPPSPTPEPTCPADNGVTLTITKAETVYEGGGSDEYKLTLELNNKIGVPVSLTPIDTLSITSVRASGEEMGAGSISVPETYEVPPGRRTFTTESTYHAIAAHAFGSPITSWKLSGEMAVVNATSDQDTRVLYCEFKPMTYGKPLQGSWGS